jgi:hypothetical protein
LLRVEVGKSSCVLVGIRELRLSPPARYDPQCPSLLDFLSGCLVRVLWACRSSKDPARDVEQATPYDKAFLFLIKTTFTIATRPVLRAGRSPLSALPVSTAANYRGGRDQAPRALARNAHTTSGCASCAAFF